MPSTRTLKVPSGSLINCKIVDTVPTLYKSFNVGFSVFGFLCATSITDLSSAIAFCKEFIDTSRPTNKGVTTPGNITTSLKGTNGIFIYTSL